MPISVCPLLVNPGVANYRQDGGVDAELNIPERKSKRGCRPSRALSSLSSEPGPPTTLRVSVANPYTVGEHVSSVRADPVVVALSGKYSEATGATSVSVCIDCDAGKCAPVGVTLIAKS